MSIKSNRQRIMKAFDKKNFRKKFDARQDERFIQALKGEHFNWQLAGAIDECRFWISFNEWVIIVKSAKPGENSQEKIKQHAVRNMEIDSRHLLITSKFRTDDFKAKKVPISSPHSGAGYGERIPRPPHVVSQPSIHQLIDMGVLSKPTWNDRVEKIIPKKYSFYWWLNFIFGADGYKK